MSNNNLYSQLSEQFPQEMERSINKGGANLTYIPISEVINRLNKVLGVEKWSMTIQSCHRDASDPDFVIAHVRLEYFAGEHGSVVRDGIGGQKIKRNKQGQILDLGDEFKGAISDALKKAHRLSELVCILHEAKMRLKLNRSLTQPQRQQRIQFRSRNF